MVVETFGYGAQRSDVGGYGYCWEHIDLEPGMERIMSASQYRSQLDRKRRQRVEADKKADKYRSKESTKRAESAKARLAASKTRSESTLRSKLNESARKDREAEVAGKEANRWQTKAANFAKEEAALAGKLQKAERAEADEVERRRKRERQRADRQAAADRSMVETRLAETEGRIAEFERELPQPKAEKLRVLILGASSDGDLRVGREQKRIRAAVQAALHRDQIELDVRPAATTADLLDGITRFRPHVVHFSGHSNTDLIVFEDEQDMPHDGVIVSDRAFARAITATDQPPLLVLLNSCKSAAQIDNLVAGLVPFAIGMADSIGDGDAILYAAQFYAAIANGQSINSAHLSGQVALELAGLESADLPTLACSTNVDPRSAILVRAS